MHFKIIIPMYNVERWIEKTIQSIMFQKYTDYQCIIIDDFSTDNCARIVESLIDTDDRFLLIKNTARKKAMANTLAGILASNANDDDVIVTVDGDDWLAHESVLDRVKEAYDTTSCMMTHGSYQEYPSGKSSHTWMKELPDIVKICGLYRWYTWQLSHLRTFKYCLLKHINDDDLKDDSGNYIDKANDMAYIFPLAELCNGNISFIPDILYIYNRETPMNNDKINVKRQLNNAKKIRKKKKYMPVFKVNHPPITSAISIKELRNFEVPPINYNQAAQYYDAFAQMLAQLNRPDDASLYIEAEKKTKALPPKNSFVSCLITGGLGNQLFQIATTYAYGWRHDIEVKILTLFSTPMDGFGITSTYWDSISQYLTHLT